MDLKNYKKNNPIKGALLEQALTLLLEDKQKKMMLARINNKPATPQLFGIHLIEEMLKQVR